MTPAGKPAPPRPRMWALLDLFLDLVGLHRGERLARLAIHAVGFRDREPVAVVYSVTSRQESFEFHHALLTEVAGVFAA